MFLSIPIIIKKKCGDYFRWSHVYFHFKSRKLFLLNWPYSETNDSAHVKYYFAMKLNLFISSYANMMQFLLSY